ncbi:glycoside hydrolase family 15 protein [Saccharolobus islandicus]|uniref:Glycoside hydrolase 15-related protein n=1 Tax=Saccharolobus islandicus (strain REY15A) TaxID=930945 RepID=F0NEM0_SACI5|nr:glycoside hydrolase family 15 protein [Sulfolobus islandicus]ADX85003.1 glycoside hydrolase 15-related protein [Sulfolobus islandicus REY15A]
MRKEFFTIFIMFLFLTSPLLIISAKPSSQYSSPSYLLLNNWVNQSIWVVTGIPIPNPQLNGFPLYNTSIRNLYVGKYGIVNLTVNFDVLTTSAYLNLNNTINLISTNGNISILTPPNTPYILILFNTNSSTSIYVKTNTTILHVNSSLVRIYTIPVIYISTNASYIIQNNTEKIIVYKGKWFVELSVGAQPNFNISGLSKLNEMEIGKWLNSSKLPTGLPTNLLKEYYLSLLLIKDDQNPYLGTFAASPSPIYLYSWVRDSAFSAMALQLAGHYNSALKFWLWLSNAGQLQSGVWYTRYNFYDGQPDTTFGIPELDGIGLYEMGVYQYYNLTGNVTFLKQILPTIYKSVKYQIEMINESRYHLLPQDLSVWEDREAYHFWTEAINDLGLKSVAEIYRALNFSNYTTILYYEKELNQSIIGNFWNDNYFASALGVSVVFEGGKSETILSPEPPSVDSATLLPINLGYLPPTSNYSVSNFEIVNKTLLTTGGLARFPNDMYHYSQSLYDATAPEPPWIITTLFEALYLEELGKYNEALNLMNWVYDHSQHGLLPEAIDPKYAYPLPTTSPLTWSSAMFDIVALNYKPVTNSQSTTLTGYYVLGIMIAIVAIISIIIILRRR